MLDSSWADRFPVVKEVMADIYLPRPARLVVIYKYLETVLSLSPNVFSEQEVEAIHDIRRILDKY